MKINIHINNKPYHGYAECFTYSTDKQIITKEAIKIAQSIGSIVFVDKIGAGYGICSSGNITYTPSSAYVVWYPIDNLQDPRIEGSMFRCDRRLLQSEKQQGFYACGAVG